MIMKTNFFEFNGQLELLKADEQLQITGGSAAPTTDSAFAYDVFYCVGRIIRGFKEWCTAEPIRPSSWGLR